MRYQLKKIIKKTIFLFNKILKSEFYEFHCFPFNEMGAFDSDKGERALREVSGWLHEKKIIYRVTDGTILGLYRNNNFIAHDNDIDMDIMDPSNLQNTIKLLCKELNYKVGRIVVFKNQIQQVAFYNIDNIVIDFVIWRSKANEIQNFQEKGYIRKQDIKYFNKVDSFKFKNYTYPIPGFIEDWLQFRYGTDWRIPKTYKGDWKEESGDIRKT